MTNDDYALPPDHPVLQKVLQHFALRRATRFIYRESLKVDRELGLADIEHVDHVDGTDSEEFRCKVCRRTFMAKEAAPCAHCRPAESMAWGQAIRSGLLLKDPP